MYVLFVVLKPSSPITSLTQTLFPCATLLLSHHPGFRHGGAGLRGARGCAGDAGNAIPVRAHRLFRRRPPRPCRRHAGLQPRRDPARHLDAEGRLTMPKLLQALALCLCAALAACAAPRSEEHTSELQSLMRISYAVFCLKKKK